MISTAVHWSPQLILMTRCERVPVWMQLVLLILHVWKKSLGMGNLKILASNTSYLTSIEDDMTFGLQYWSNPYVDPWGSVSVSSKSMLWYFIYLCKRCSTNLSTWVLTSTTISSSTVITPIPLYDYKRLVLQCTQLSTQLSNCKWRSSTLQEAIKTGQMCIMWVCFCAFRTNMFGFFNKNLSNILKTFEFCWKGCYCMD